MTVDKGGYPPATGVSGSLGDTFRTTRMAAGVSVEQVESDLRIKAKYIEAIEDGDTVALPSKAYTDGFLRNYATYLGMDPADAVRRFAAEQGLSAPKGRAMPTAPMPKAQKNNPLSAYAAPAPRRSFFGSIGRGAVAMLPLFLVAGLGFGGYTGFVAARDAGLIPEEFGGKAANAVVAIEKSSRTTSSESADPVRTASVDAKKVPASPEAQASGDEESAKPDAPAPVVAAKSDLVGDETSAGRPDELTYARPGSTPYWQAKPPAVEPIDGPVSDIEPEDAGLLRAASEEEEKPSRWSSSGASDTAPADVDASRIAAAAREALGGSSDSEVAASSDGAGIGLPDDSALTMVASLETPLAPVFGGDAASTEFFPTDAPAQPQYGIGPAFTVDEVGSDLAPAVSTQAPRQFALVARADAWVQVTDAIGNVTYTGILSPGEAYNIPSQEGLRLQTGNAGGLFIEVDGRRFGPLGSNGAVMRNVVLNPGAVQASFTLSQAASLQQ